MTSLEEWMDKTPIAINSATLVFDVVPEEESGIPVRRFAEPADARNHPGGWYPMNPFMIILCCGPMIPAEQPQDLEDIKKLNPEVCFLIPPIPTALIWGSIFNPWLTESKPDNDFILQLDDGIINPKFSKLWSNLPANKKRIRLEIVYLKL